MANSSDDGFNGSTITFTISGESASIFGGLRSMEFTESAPKVNVTGSGDSTTTYRTGVPDPALTVTWVGGLPAANADVGDQGALVVVWEDTTTDGAIANAIIVDRGTSGSMDGEIISTMTFATGQADTP
jgi:hypothetical protein